jgi:pyruvate dehydrogenase E1 component alpha subunit
VRGEAAYQQGHVGGFYHSYVGQEAIATAAVHALGKEENWWIATYRCHGICLLLGLSPNEMMAELYGKETGNAQGRGGSMHLFGDRLLGGFGIVGGHVPIACGAAFSLKYQNQKGIAICFLGDGAVVQGAVQEALNLASLWSLPVLFVIENNHWGMGTAVKRAVCCHPLGTHLAKHYDVSSYTFDGMDFFNCYAGFKTAREEMEKTGRPIIIEAITERFRGHSISDPGLYRSKEELDEVKSKDPIPRYIEALKKHRIVDDKSVEAMEKEQKELILAAMKYAEESSWPHPAVLEEDVFAP